MPAVHDPRPGHAAPAATPSTASSTLGPPRRAPTRWTSPLFWIGLGAVHLVVASVLALGIGEVTARAAEPKTVSTTTTPTPTSLPTTTTTSAPPTPPPMPPPAPPMAMPLPVGKGMWIWQPEETEGGDVEAMVNRARAVGLTHVYVRTGSSRQGFSAPAFLDAVLPAMHDADIRVYGWDFPYLTDPIADARRAAAAIAYRTPSGDRLDGFVADIETPSEGTALTPGAAATYGRDVRSAVGDRYPLIVAVPRPSSLMIERYPYAQVVEPFSAIAPMVYWLNRQPDSDAAAALDWLARFHKPLLPIGQAYDGSDEGGRPGVPSRNELLRFTASAQAHGAPEVSFWSWQHADQEAWDAIRDAPEFRLASARPETMNAPEVRAVQTLLTGLGHPAPVTGTWDGKTQLALTEFQHAHGPVTTWFDPRTRAAVLDPGKGPDIPVGPVPAP